jgi:hypothetical protein
MAADKGPPSGPPGPRGRRRPAPTIDLKATEVARAAAESPPAPEPGRGPPSAAPPPAAEPARSSPAAQASAEPVPPSAAAQASAETPRDPPPPPSRREPLPPPGRHPPPPAGDPPPQATHDSPPPPSGSGPPPERSGPRIAWLPPDFPWPLAAAGAGGAVLALIAVAIAGSFSGRDGSRRALELRLERAEQQMREFAARPAPAAADPRAVEDLAARLGRLETTVATPRPPVTDPALANRIATLEGEIKALAERVGVLGRRNDEIASIAADARARANAGAAALAELKKAAPPAAGAVQRSDLDALSARIAALEQSAKALRSDIARRVGEAGADRALRLVVIANALNAAIEAGRPFASELAAAKQLTDPRSLAPLDPYAGKGVATAAALARELAALLPALAKGLAAPQQQGGSFLQRLQANAKKIVRVRPIDEVPGDDPSAVLSRLEMRAAEADLAGALTELAKLPAAARAPAKGWIARVEARNAAVGVSRRFAADALAAIGKPSL